MFDHTWLNWRSGNEILGKSGGILKFIDVSSKPDDIRRLVYDKYRLKNWINCDIDDKLNGYWKEYRVYLKQSSEASPTFLENAERFVTKIQEISAN